MTTWTCTRCGRTEQLAGLDQPKDWVRVGFVCPPKASWTDRLTVVGDLCNGPDCGGLIVAFMHGTEAEEILRQDQYAAAMGRVAADAD